MPFCTVNGVDLFYDETGSGEPIVLHHGFTGSHDVWWNSVAPRLADRYRCIVMDCRGAGDSSHPADGYTIEQYARDVVALADALALGRFTFVGHSMGGGIGMQLSVAHSDRLERLVLVAPIGSGGLVDNPALREEQRALRASPDGRSRLLAERRVQQVREWTETSQENELDRALSVSEGHYEESWTAMVNFDVREQLKHATTPTLMVAGAADMLLPANLEDYMRLPNATLHVFSRVGHHIPADVPDEFVDIIADFMEHGVVNGKTQMAKLEEYKAAVTSS